MQDCKWRPQRRMVINESPYTGRRQHGTLRFHRWEFSVQYATTRGATALAKRAALAALKGGDVAFNFRDPSLATPQSGYLGTALVNGTPTGYTVTLKNVTNNTLIVKAGDYFSVEYSSGKWQLFSAAADATSNGSGLVSITTHQPIRGTLTDGSTVKVKDWFVTVTLDGNEEFDIDRRGNLILPPLRFVEDF